MSKKIKIVCSVSGGILESVHITPDVDADIVLYDFDDDEGDGDPRDPDKYEAEWKKDIKGLKEIL